ncbi:MAG: FAD-binding oxidoreductase [Acidimicrobiales bacterium]
MQELRTKIRGDVLVPGDAGYGDVRATFNAMHESRPDVVVRCSGTADVIDAVNFARNQGLQITVRGGGHSIAGLSAPNGGLLVDLSSMNGVQIDPDRRLAHVQGGALWGDVDREAQTFGLVTPGGVVSDTGVAGLTLGGGYGWMRRKYGLSCDNVVEAQVVCADGRVLTASAESNPDLYWALRGGGGNFGIVTSFTFRLHSLSPIVAFAGVFYAVEDAPAVLRAWRDYVAVAPDEVTSIAVSFTFPPVPDLPEVVHNRACLVIGAVYADDLEEGLEILKPLGALGTPLADLTGPAPFTFVQSAFDELFQRGQFRSYWKSQYLDEFSDEAIDAFAALAESRPKPLCVVNIWPMGGAISRVGPEDTAFAERTAPFMISIDGNWEEPEFDAEGVTWVRAAWSKIGEFGNGSTYLNFTGLADEAADTGVESALGRNLRRLAEIKAAYDPDNFFRRNNNIAPT